LADSLILTIADLKQHLLDNIPAGHAANRIQWPNAKKVDSQGQKWLRVSATNLDTDDVATGAGYRRTFGIFVIEVNVVKDAGDVAAIADAHALKLSFQNQNLSNTKTLESSVILTGANDSWYTVQIQTNYYYEG